MPSRSKYFFDDQKVIPNGYYTKLDVRKLTYLYVKNLKSSYTEATLHNFMILRNT